MGFDLRNQAAAVTETFHRDVLAGKGGRVIRIARSVGEFVTGRNRTANLVDNVRNQTAGEHLIGIGFRSGLRGHGRIGGVGSPRGRIGHGPGQFREILTGGLPVVVIEEIDVNGLDGQRVQAGSGLHGAHFETRHQRFELHGGFLQRVAVGRRLGGERRLLTVERYLLYRKIVAGSVAFDVSGTDGLDCPVLIGNGQVFQPVFDTCKRRGPRQQGRAARIRNDNDLGRLDDLLETLLLRRNLGVGPGITHRIVAGIDQIDHDVLIVRCDLACGLRVFDTIGLQGTRKRYREIGLRGRGRRPRFGVLAACSQRHRRQSGDKISFHLHSFEI